MASQRKDILAQGYIYHVFNRSVERRPIFTNEYEYRRMRDLLWYYRFASIPMRYSQLLSLPEQTRKDMRRSLEKEGEFEVELYAFALMPNHFHLLVKQLTTKGIPVFLSNISNSFAKYFNVRHKRTGSLWQRPFKAVRIETEEQFLHVSRYIHLNPVTSLVIKEDMLDTYPWTSLPEYLAEVRGGRVCRTDELRGRFKTAEAHRLFVHNHADYAKHLEAIKHLSLDREEWV